MKSFIALRSLWAAYWTRSMSSNTESSEMIYVQTWRPECLKLIFSHDGEIMSRSCCCLILMDSFEFAPLSFVPALSITMRSGKYNQQYAHFSLSTHFRLPPSTHSMHWLLLLFSLAMSIQSQPTDYASLPVNRKNSWIRICQNGNSFYLSLPFTRWKKCYKLWKKSSRVEFYAKDWIYRIKWT